MSTTTVDSLFSLLPAVYRLRDAAEAGEPLRALLSIFAEQIAMMEEDLAQLYDDQFVETCAEWVLPYIGDLAGTTPLFDASRIRQLQTARSLFPDLAGPRFIPSVALRSRTDVARTISFRRRKATRPMLEELAESVTGWATHVVEMFEILKWTQCVRNHLRPFNHAAPDLHRVVPLGRIHRAFDEAAHHVDVRPIAQPNGWHGIRNIAFFLWRLRSYRLVKSTPARVCPYQFRFDPVGTMHPASTNLSPGKDTPLFSAHCRTELEVSRESDVPQAIRPELFCEDLRRGVELQNFSIEVNGVPVAQSRIRGANLEDWMQPPGDLVAVDVRRGRITFGPDAFATNVLLTWQYGFPADLGGGPYPRSSWLIKPKAQTAIIPVKTTIYDALKDWRALGQPDAILVIGDSRTYEETQPLLLDAPDDIRLAIEARDRCRPHLKLYKTMLVGHPKANENTCVTLSGVVVEGDVRVAVPRGCFRLIHSTLVPLRRLVHGTPRPMPSLVVDSSPNADLRVEIAFSITGALRIPDTTRGVWLLDSIVDGLGDVAIDDSVANRTGPRGWIERTTIFGETRFSELTLATETIFRGRVQVERLQTGCVRFSWVPDGSATPRRYRCQPDLAIEGGMPRRDAAIGTAPFFTSMRYGDAAYAQLHLNAPQEITRGAEDGSEMGAYCHLKQPQREANLRTRLREYLPFGLEPGLIYVT